MIFGTFFIQINKNRKEKESNSDMSPQELRQKAIESSRVAMTCFNHDEMDKAFLNYLRCDVSDCVDSDS